MLSWYTFIRFSVTRLLVVKFAKFSGIEKGEISAGCSSGRFLCLELPASRSSMQGLLETAEEENSIELLISSDMNSLKISLLEVLLFQGFGMGEDVLGVANTVSPSENPP